MCVCVRVCSIRVCRCLCVSVSMCVLRIVSAQDSALYRYFSYCYFVSGGLSHVRPTMYAPTGNQNKRKQRVDTELGLFE